MTADQVLVLRTIKLDTALDRRTAFQQWKAKIQNMQYVKATCGVNWYPGEKEWRSFVHLSSDPEKNKKGFRLTGVTSDYINTMGIRLLYGRDFHDEPYDNNKAIISETAARELGYSNVALAVGSLITLEYGEKHEIIGVVRDFRLSAKDIVFGEILVPASDYSYFLVGLSSNDLMHSMAQLEDQWNDLFPNSRFDYFFLDSFFETFYEEEQRFTSAFVFFSMIGIFITCMGLFGLSLYNTISRTKEIGIRKSLGGSSQNIIWLFSIDYMKLVLTASILGIPIGYWLLNTWLENYPNRITLGADVILIPLMLMIAIAMLTVGYQTFRAAHMNPVESLKSE